MLMVLMFGGHFGKEKNVLPQYCQLTCTGFLGMPELQEFFYYIICTQEWLL